MNFNKTVEETLLEMLNNDIAFKSVFEEKVKSKILSALDEMDFGDIINRGITNMIDYMLTEDSYIYENVRDSISNMLENSIRISFMKEEVNRDGKENT